MRKINEIFYSLQGEGFHTGTPAVFVRFSGCNLKCSFCDTQHEEFRMMTDDEIIAEVCTYPCQMVILTGGEPGLSIDSQLTKALHAAGKYIAIETNGTCVLPEDIDWVTCSPKEGTTLKLHHIDEVKVVYLILLRQRHRIACIPTLSYPQSITFCNHVPDKIPMM